MHLHTLSVHRLGELLGRREVSSEEVTRACLERMSHWKKNQPL